MQTGYQVLVVDDSPFVFKAVKRALEPQGFQVVGNAPNGQVGLEMVEQLHPDLITLDVTMPVMDGLETARHLYRRNPNAKVIMLSAMGDEELIREASALGVRHFLAKPFKAEELVALARGVLSEVGCQSAGE